MFGHETASRSDRPELLIADFVRIRAAGPAGVSIALADLVERVVMDEEAAVALAVTGVLPSMQDVRISVFATASAISSEYARLTAPCISSLFSL